MGRWVVLLLIVYLVSAQDAGRRATKEAQGIKEDSSSPRGGFGQFIIQLVAGIAFLIVFLVTIAMMCCVTCTLSLALPVVMVVVLAVSVLIGMKSPGGLAWNASNVSAFN